MIASSTVESLRSQVLRVNPSSRSLRCSTSDPSLVHVAIQVASKLSLDVECRIAGTAKVLFGGLILRILSCLGGFYSQLVISTT